MHTQDSIKIGNERKGKQEFDIIVSLKEMETMRDLMPSIGVVSVLHADEACRYEVSVL